MEIYEIQIRHSIQFKKIISIRSRKNKKNINKKIKINIFKTFLLIQNLKKIKNNKNILKMQQN